MDRLRIGLEPRASGKKAILILQGRWAKGNC